VRGSLRPAEGSRLAGMLLLHRGSSTRVPRLLPFSPRADRSLKSPAWGAETDHRPNGQATDRRVAPERQDFRASSVLVRNGRKPAGQ